MTSADVIETHSTSLKPLVWLEIRRFARHPAFLTGLTLCTVVLVMAERDAVARPNNDRVGGAGVSLFVGVFSMLAAYLLTRSMKDAAEILEATPTPMPSRTAALCAVCSVSALCAAVFGVFGLISLVIWPIPGWVSGTFTNVDIVVVMAGQTVVASVGGALLGVAAGRWLRFRGAGFALIVALYLWVGLSSGIADAQEPGGTWAKLVRAFSPLASFQHQQDPASPVDTFAGSPRWYLLWLVALCALAAVAALLRGAEGIFHTRLMRLGPVLLATAAVFLALTVTQGQQHDVRSFPNGTTTVITSR